MHLSARSARSQMWPGIKRFKDVLALRWCSAHKEIQMSTYCVAGDLQIKVTFTVNSFTKTWLQENHGLLNYPPPIGRSLLLWRYSPWSSRMTLTHRQPMGSRTMDVTVITNFSMSVYIFMYIYVYICTFNLRQANHLLLQRSWYIVLYFLISPFQSPWSFSCYLPCLLVANFLVYIFNYTNSSWRILASLSVVANEPTWPCGQSCLQAYNGVHNKQVWKTCTCNK